MKYKALPIGVENFEQMVEKEQNYYYVDKTLMIRDLLDKGGYVNLFTRPRRFGKSLSISMIQYFFDKQMIDKKHAFDGLKILEEDAKYLEHQNRYPVIKMTLKGTGMRKFESAFKKLIEKISAEYKRHLYLLSCDEMLASERELYQKIIEKKASYEEYTNSLMGLSNYLERYHQEKVIILIDEYDVPLEKAHFNGYYEEMIEFIRSFFDDALKTNDSLKFAVITGCLRVSKESIFTGLNNLNIVSILSDSFGECFGFTQVEVDAMLAHYELTAKTDEMRDWYNGYLFGETTVYNPWSSIKYLYDQIHGKIYLPIPHWSNTSSNAIIKDLIEISDNEAKKEIEMLIAGGTITKPINEDIVYAEIKESMDNLWNFLYFTGYLKKVSKAQVGVHNHFELEIPNKEIKYIYEKQIMTWFNKRVEMTDLKPLYTALLEKDALTLADELNETLVETISFMDSHENFYHGFLTGMFRGMKGYLVKSNRESGNGRGDIFIRGVSMRKPAIVIEVKVAKRMQDLEKESQIALDQIEEKKYVEELNQEGYREIIKYGIAFYRKDCDVRFEK